MVQLGIKIKWVKVSSNLLPTKKMIYINIPAEKLTGRNGAPAVLHRTVTFLKENLGCPDRETVEQENYYCLSRLKSLFSFFCID